MYTLQPNLHQLKRYHDKSFCRTCRRPSKDGQALRHLGHSEEIAVDLPPFVVGGKLGGTLGSFHEDGGNDTTVQAGESE